MLLEMTPSAHFLSYDLELLSCILYCLFLFFHCFYDRRPSIKIITGYYFLAALMVYRSIYHLENGTNIDTYAMLCLITSLFIGVYFFMTLHARWKKNVVVVLCLIQSVYYLFSKVLSPNPLIAFDSIGYTMLSTGIMIMVFLYMHQILTNVREEKLSMNFDFWFVCSQMVYHFGSFVIFLTFSYMTLKIMPHDYSNENRTLMVQIWGIHNVLLFLSALLTCSSIVWIAFQKKSPSSS